MFKKIMFKKIILSCLLAAATVAGLAQSQPGLPSNRELVAKAKSMYIDSETIFMKREQLVDSLLGKNAFKAWEIQITSKPELADLVVRVGRVPFRTHFTYAVTDRLTNTIVLAGTVDSLAGTVHGQIADEIVQKMKVFRGDPPAAQASPKS